MSRPIACLVSLLLATAAAAAPPPSPAAIVEEHGLATATFTTPQGNVIVRMPSEAAEGDMLSGTVSARPADPSQPASSELTGMVVEVRSGDSQGTANPRTRHFILRSGRETVAILRNLAGREVGRARLPTVRLPDREPRPAPSVADFVLPDLVQAGHPARVSGPFDGDLRNTRARLGESDILFVAESPDRAFLDVPAGITGPLPLSITEGDVTVEGETHAVKVSISAPRTMLQAGEGTTVTVKVDGLAGLPADSEPELRITNRSPEVVTLAGGEPVAVVPIDGSAIQAGSIETSLPLTAIEAGGFTLTVDVTSKKGRCGKAFHAKSYNRLSKGKSGDRYTITYVIHCESGTCDREAGHEGKCSGPSKPCGDHPDDPKEESFATKKERDARFAELSGIKKG